MKHNCQPDCETILFEISDHLDDSGVIPAALLEQAEQCPECLEFIELWKNGAPLQQLAQQATEYPQANINYDRIASAITELDSTQSSPAMEQPASQPPKAKTFPFLLKLVIPAAAVVLAAVIITGNNPPEASPQKAPPIADLNPDNSKPDGPKSPLPFVIPKITLNVAELGEAIQKPEKELENGAQYLNEKSSSVWRSAKSKFVSVENKFFKVLHDL